MIMDNTEDKIGAIGSVRSKSPDFAQTGDVQNKAATQPAAGGAGDAAGAAATPQLAPTGLDDTFQTSEKPLLSRREIEEKAAAQAQKDQLIQSMIVKDAKVGAPDDKSIQALTGTLSQVDTDVLRYNQENGAKFVVVKEGQDLMDTGVIRKQDPAAINAQAPELGRKGQDAMAKVEAEYGPKLKEVEDKIAASPMKKEEGWAGFMNGGKSPENPQEYSKLQMQQLDLQNGQRKQAYEQVEKATGGKAKIFTPAEATDSNPAGAGGGFLALAMASQAQMPMSTEDMARNHGAKTPEEIKQFTDSVEKLNGDRLTQMRQQTISAYEANVAGMDPAQKKEAVEALEKLEQNPQTIPIDHFNKGVLVPNTYYYRSADKPDSAPTVVDTHDNLSLQSWNKNQGKIGPAGEGATLGQHFGEDGMNTIVIRDTNLADRSPIHELGHATQGALRKNSPEFAGQIDAMAEKAYSNLDRGGFGQGTQESITPYATLNKDENLCEGFADYYRDPKLLKLKDPELFGIVQQQTDFIKSQ